MNVTYVTLVSHHKMQLLFLDTKAVNMYALKRTFLVI
jgi:hypothetical protein